MLVEPAAELLGVGELVQVRVLEAGPGDAQQLGLGVLGAVRGTGRGRPVGLGRRIGERDGGIRGIVERGGGVGAVGPSAVIGAFGGAERELSDVISRVSSRTGGSGNGLRISIDSEQGISVRRAAPAAGRALRVRTRPA